MRRGLNEFEFEFKFEFEFEFESESESGVDNRSAGLFGSDLIVPVRT